MISFAIFLVLKAKESKKKGGVKIIHVINACRISSRASVDVSWDWISGEGWSVFRGWQEFAVLCGFLTRCFVRVRHSASSGCHEALPEGVMKHCMRTSRSASLWSHRSVRSKKKEDAIGGMASSSILFCPYLPLFFFLCGHVSFDEQAHQLRLGIGTQRDICRYRYKSL